MTLPLKKAFKIHVFLSHAKYFSQGNNVLDPPASNFDGLIPRNIVFRPFTSMALYCTKLMFLTIENLERNTVFLFKGNSDLTGNKCDRPSSL
jgi:hypothetical protein